MSEQINIALAGNPNCGKTTLFNELTGSNGYVGNWPGVTVEKLQATWKSDRNVMFVDLPGIYSLSPYSPEEVVSRDYLVDDKPEAVIDLVDVTNLERNLYLTTQLLETGRPVVVGLNMCDLLESHGIRIDVERLSQMLGCPVLEVSALRNTNLDTLVTRAVELGKANKPQTGVKCFSDSVEAALTTIAAGISGNCDKHLERWFAIKVFERDASAIEQLKLSKDKLAEFEGIIKAVEDERSDDAESIITTDRYEWIATVMEACVRKEDKGLTTSQRIDKIVTNRVLGLPIFAAVMILVYYISISTVGATATDWVNENLFADGFFVNAASEEAYNEAADDYASNYYADQIDAYLAAAEEAGLDTEEVSAAIEDGDEAAIESFVSEAESAGVVAYDVAIHDEDGNYVDTEGEAITTLDANGDPVLDDGQELETIAAVTASDFLVAATAEEPDPASYDGFIDSIPNAVTNALESAGASELVVALVVDGVVAGVGAILGFIPQMAIFFVMLCFLEDCGYMSRVAFVMDRVFRRFGMSGKSFIPMLVSSGCGVPGVLATKTIENERDRRMTAMLTTMIPCGAKLPIIALVMGVLAGGSDMWWVAPMFYFLGILSIIISALMLKKTKPFAGEAAPFVMELPDYHVPSIKSWVLHVWERVWSYVRKAGTIIFASSVLVWFLSNFGVAGWAGGSGSFGYLVAMENAPEAYMDWSLLAGIGEALSFIFAPLGFGNWQAVGSTISALIAKENLVSTFGVLYGLGEVTESSANMWAGFANMFTIGGTLHAGAMCAFVAFNMLCAPCFAAIGTIRRQMDSPKWFWFAIGYECVFAWVIGLFINQFYELIVFGSFGIWTAIAFVLLAAMLFQLFRPTPHYEQSEDRILESLSA